MLDVPRAVGVPSRRDYAVRILPDSSDNFTSAWPLSVRQGGHHLAPLLLRGIGPPESLTPRGDRTGPRFQQMAVANPITPGRPGEPYALGSPGVAGLVFDRPTGPVVGTRGAEGEIGAEVERKQNQTCLVETCERKPYRHGVCRWHYLDFDLSLYTKERPRKG